MEIDLDIAEIPFESGSIRFCYSRYLAPDKTRWIRHGLFRAFYPSGVLSSEGLYEHGLETGVWRDFHENGFLAAEGEYERGQKIGVWKFWDSKGHLESESTEV